MLFFSTHDPPVLPAMPRVNDLPLVGPWLARSVLPLARRATRDWGEPVQRLRAELGLPRGRDPMFEGQFSPHGTLALFSRVLAEPQPDWPPNVTTTGTVFYNGPEPLEPKLEEFLAAGEPPVVFTLGTSAVGAAGRFYHESAAAAAKLGVRAVLLTGGFAQNRPDDLAAERAARRPRAASAAVPARERRRASVRRRHDGASAAQRPADAARAARPRSVRQCAPRAQARRRAHAVPEASTAPSASRASCARCSTTRATASARPRQRDRARGTRRRAAVQTIEALLR